MHHLRALILIQASASVTSFCGMGVAYTQGSEEFFEPRCPWIARRRLLAFGHDRPVRMRHARIVLPASRPVSRWTSNISGPAMDKPHAVTWDVPLASKRNAGYKILNRLHGHFQKQRRVDGNIEEELAIVCAPTGSVTAELEDSVFFVTRLNNQLISKRQLSSPLIYRSPETRNTTVPRLGVGCLLHKS